MEAPCGRGMMLSYPSATTVVVSLFVVYILHCVWVLSTLFVPPQCNDSEPCLRSSLLTRNKLMIAGFITDKNLRLYPQQEPIWNEILEFDKPAEWTKPVKIPPHVRKNGTLYLAVFVFPERAGLINGGFIMNEAEKSVTRIKLTQLHVPAPQTFNLLGSEAKDGAHGKKNRSEPTKRYKVNHIKRRVAVNMMATHVNLPKFSLPPEMHHMFLINSRVEYLPPLQYNFMATRLKDLEEVTPEKEKVDVTLIYAPTSFGKMRFLLHMETSMISLKTLGFSEKDLDDIKGIFEDTNMVLLLLTVVVASTHLVLDFLALRHDINYWKTRTDLSGVSGRSVLWRAFSQTVVFFYLLDEKTSLLVLVPSGLNTLLEMWKVKKIVIFVPNRTRWGLPFYSMELKRSSRGEELTQQLDAEAMRYLTYLLYPLCFAGAIYSLLYEPHRGWYSWTIHSMVNGVYAFGFLFMLPQLFINYRLKSVAHIPWRSFMYKAINTFIDDVFAFIITMPTSHRVACFRDDVVFIIYLYQRWLYPVDQSRVEGGSVGEEVRDLNEKVMVEQDKDEENSLKLKKTLQEPIRSKKSKKND